MILPPRKLARSPTEPDERMSLEACRHCSQRHRDLSPTMSVNSSPTEAVTATCVEAIAAASPVDVMKVRNAVVAVAAGAMDAHSVRLASLVVHRVASLNEEAAALFAVECVRDALVAMSRHASTSSAVRWVSLVLHAVTSGRSRCVKELFANVAVRNALVNLSHKATTPSAVEAVSMALSDLTLRNAAHWKEFSSECVRDGLLSMVGSATTPRSIEVLAKVFYNCIGFSCCETFLCVRVRDALLTMCAAAMTAEGVWQVSNALHIFALRPVNNLVNGRVKVKRMVTTCEVRDAVVMLASRATTSKCAGKVAATFEWTGTGWKGPPEMFWTPSVHDALVELASKVTEPEDVSACACAVALFRMKAQSELVTHVMRDAVVGLVRYATTLHSANSIKKALIALKSTYHAGSLSRVIDGELDGTR
ncbi:Hypothetical protein, putative [Bodo saltans]|uniref:Uncharacterized protein n=1 Tax=Bodo saltans TaxID=75058 RepID=A0A0S4JQV3_BODSA|nr:Hypothetical protein, putative [Bodo saltans]|eukprot:CUG93883.1 Hypothetical protein, putative [Bodo saltans]